MVGTPYLVVPNIEWSLLLASNRHLCYTIDEFHYRRLLRVELNTAAANRRTVAT